MRILGVGGRHDAQTTRQRHQRGAQLGQVDGLGQVVVGAQAQARYLVLAQEPPGEHDDAHRRIGGAQVRYPRQAVAVRQHGVQHEDGGRDSEQQRVQLGQRARGEDGFVQAQVLDVLGDGIAPISVVVDDDDRHGAARLRAPWANRNVLVML